MERCIELPNSLICPPSLICPTTNVGNALRHLALTFSALLVIVALSGCAIEDARNVTDEVAESAPSNGFAISLLATTHPTEKTREGVTVEANSGANESAPTAVPVDAAAPATVAPAMEATVIPAAEPIADPTEELTLPTVVLYDEVLGFSWVWQKLSWGVEAEEQNSEYAYSGNRSLRVEMEEFGGLALSTNSPLRVYAEQRLEFWVRAADVEQAGLQVFINNLNDPTLDNELHRIDVAGNYVEGGSIDSESWRKVTIPLSNLGVDGFLVRAIRELDFHSPYAGQAPTFYLDDIRIVGTE